MTQYLLSVWHDGEPVMPPEDDMQRMFAQVDEFNTRIQDAGVWVFGGGLHPASSATVVRAGDGNGR